MTKEELQKIKHLDDRISRKQRELDDLRLKKYCVKSFDYSKDRVQSSENNSGFELTIEKITDLEIEITRDIDKLVDMKNKAREVINNLEGIYLEVIEMRYLEYLSWRDIARIKCYSIQGIYKIHGQALLKLKE